MEEPVRVECSEAEKIYNNGGTIRVDYIFICDDQRRVNKSTTIAYTDYGIPFTAIKKAYKTSSIESVEYYVDKDTYNASAMCNLICD